VRARAIFLDSQFQLIFRDSRLSARLGISTQPQEIDYAEQKSALAFGVNLKLRFLTAATTCAT
jgi:hypothetical protein